MPRAGLDTGSLFFVGVRPLANRAVLYEVALAFQYTPTRGPTLSGASISAAAARSI